MEQRPIVAFQAICDLNVSADQVPPNFIQSWVDYNIQLTNDNRANADIKDQAIELNGYCQDDAVTIATIVSNFLKNWNNDPNNPAVEIRTICKEKLQAAFAREAENINPQPHPVGNYEAELHGMLNRAGLLPDKYNKGHKGPILQEGDIFKLPFGAELDQLYYSEDQAVPLEQVFGLIVQAEARLIDVCNPDYAFESIEHAVEQINPQVSRWCTIALPMQQNLL